MTTLLKGTVHPISSPDLELELARTSSIDLAGRFDTQSCPVTLRFTDPRTGEEVESTVPAAALQLLSAALSEMAAGHSVTLLPLRAELGTQQAAEIAGVSRPYLVKLLEMGRIPFRRVGAQRRIRHSDLLRFLEDERNQAIKALSEMVAENEELGLYE